MGGRLSKRGLWDKPATSCYTASFLIPILFATQRQVATSSSGVVCSEQTCWIKTFLFQRSFCERRKIRVGVQEAGWGVAAASVGVICLDPRPRMEMGRPHSWPAGWFPSSDGEDDQLLVCLLHCIALIDSLLTHYKTHLTKWQSKKRRIVTMLVRLTMLMVTIVDHLDHQVGAQAELQQGRNSQWEHWSWPSRGQQLKVRILPSSFVIIIVSIFLINYDDQSRNSSSAYHCHHGCDTVAASIFIVIVMITKEEVWTASMTRQNDTPSFLTQPIPPAARVRNGQIPLLWSKLVQEFRTWFQRLQAYHSYGSVSCSRIVLCSGKL